MTTALQPPLPSSPSSVCVSHPAPAMPRRIDGAWWPRSYELLVELPRLLAGLPQAWGHISSVTVNGATWSATPGRMLVFNQVVRLRRSTTMSAPDTVCLLAPSRGRWDLLVVPPDTLPDTAEPLMAAAVGDDPI